MAEEMLPWLVAPKNAEEFAVLEKRLSSLMEELFLKHQIIASNMRVRIERPKAGSKWAQRVAFARLDLRWHARAVTKPFAAAGAAYIAAAKSIRTSLTRYYELQAATKNRVGGGVNLDR